MTNKEAIAKLESLYCLQGALEKASEKNRSLSAGDTSTSAKVGVSASANNIAQRGEQSKAKYQSWDGREAFNNLQNMTPEERREWIRKRNEEMLALRQQRVDEARRSARPSTAISDRDTQGRRLTAAQQEFFKDSKARDDDGNLKVLYHGTGSFGFSTIDFSRAQDGISFFLTDSIQTAESYFDKQAEGSGMYELYANMKDPFASRQGMAVADGGMGRGIHHEPRRGVRRRHTRQNISLATARQRHGRRHRSQWRS